MIGYFNAKKQSEDKYLLTNDMGFYKYVNSPDRKWCGPSGRYVQTHPDLRGTSAPARTGPFFPDTARGSEYRAPDRYDPDGRYAARADPG